MSSPAQVTANLANAQHSTGPRTDAGKAVSSANSLKHGLTAKSVLLPGEDEAAYRKMCARMFSSFNPGNEPEQQLVQLLCDTQWRLQRCGRIESAILSEDAVDFKAIDIMSKHEARLKKQYSATLKEARDLIDSRLTREDEALKKALTIRRADKLNGSTTDLQAIGFVFSTEEIDAAMLVEDAFTKAKKAINRESMSKMPGFANLFGTKNQAQ
jgi:hypothetical protein